MHAEEDTKAFSSPGEAVDGASRDWFERLPIILAPLAKGEKAA